MYYVLRDQGVGHLGRHQGIALPALADAKEMHHINGALKREPLGKLEFVLCYECQLTPHSFCILASKPSI